MGYSGCLGKHKNTQCGSLIQNVSGSERLNKEQAKQVGLNRESLEKKAITALPKLMKGQEQQAETKDWHILMRPVLAAKQECLDCHTKAKMGDTLGVMVYAVRKTTRKF